MASDNLMRDENASLAKIKNMAIRRKEELKKEIELLIGELKKVEDVLAITDDKGAGQESLKDSLIAKDDRIGLAILKIFEESHKRRVPDEQNINFQKINKMLDEKHGIKVSRATIYNKLRFFEKVGGIMKTEKNFWTLNVPASDKE